MILIEILNKIMLIIFILSFLNIFRHVYLVLQIMLRPDDEIKERYLLTDKSLLILGLSISYVLASIITWIFL